MANFSDQPLYANVIKVWPLSWKTKAKSEMASISKQPALFTDPIFSDGFGSCEVHSEHQKCNCVA